MADNNQGGRGFQNMDPERQREIASEGGKAAHKSGNANQFDSESGRKAGQKGGQARSNSSDTSESAGEVM